eukprot:9298860-Heterocapsa_arctica.AAC.1
MLLRSVLLQIVSPIGKVHRISKSGAVDEDPGEVLDDEESDVESSALVLVLEEEVGDRIVAVVFKVQEHMRIQSRKFN